MHYKLSKILMGTIDISYLSLSIGLLLLLIPLFYIWKFKTGLLRATLIGTARMIVQLFFIGVYLKYLFLWNNPWINFLWVIVMILVASQTALARTQLKRKILLILRKLFKVFHIGCDIIRDILHKRHHINLIILFTHNIIKKENPYELTRKSKL